MKLGDRSDLNRTIVELRHFLVNYLESLLFQFESNHSGIETL